MRAVQRGLGYVSLDVFTCTYAYSVLLAIIVLWILWWIFFCIYIIYIILKQILNNLLILEE